MAYSSHTHTGIIIISSTTVYMIYWWSTMKFNNVEIKQTLIYKQFSFLNFTEEKKTFSKILLNSSYSHFFFIDKRYHWKINSFILNLHSLWLVACYFFVLFCLFTVHKIAPEIFLLRLKKIIKPYNHHHHHQKILYFFYHKCHFKDHHVARVIWMKYPTHHHLPKDNQKKNWPLLTRAHSKYC